MYTRDNSDLPVPVIISVKAFFLYIVFFNYGLINPLSYDLPFLPFIPVFDAVPSEIYQVLSLVLGISVLLPILIKKYYQVFALVSGFIVLFFILSSKILFSNSLTFAACFLLLTGLFYGKIYIFRIQISLLYLGAAVNKFFTEDWWNGIFIDYLFRDVFQISLYHQLIPSGEMSAAIAIGIIVMFMELALGLLVLVPKYTRVVIALGLSFHGSMLILTAGSLSIFFMYTISAAFAAISGFRPQHIVLSNVGPATSFLLTRLDVTDTIVAERFSSKEPFTIHKGGKAYTGRRAWREMILSGQAAMWFWFTFMIGWFFLPKVLQKVIPFIFS